MGLALIGAIIASYLALHQYGVVGPVWEHFFGDGSERVLASPLSFALPISDAALGALGYIADAVAGAVGSPSRWRTNPWLVLLFAVLVGPLGAISIALVVAQPLLYDAWCTLCLASAAISIAMIGPAMDEALAALQHLGRVARRRDRSLWRAFWGTARRHELAVGDGRRRFLVDGGAGRRRVWRPGEPARAVARLAGDLARCAV